MEPLFTGVSNNARHLYTLLSCIGFASKATVQITPDGLRFSAEEARVIQGLAFLDKSLFTSYTFKPSSEDSNLPEKASQHTRSSDEVEFPHFVVSLSALLETLKIFGINDLTEPHGSRDTNLPQTNPASSAFSAPALLMDHSCTLQYAQHGAPLTIAITEAGVKTTCELVTYEPDDDEIDIPLQRDAIIMKIIMRSAWLHNAIAELDSSNPTILKLSACANREPYFALTGAGGPFSESTVEFSIDQHNEIIGGNTQGNSASQAARKVLTDDGTSRPRATRAKAAPTVTETFQVSPPSSMGERILQSYRFALVRKAARAMAVANKVSIRGDRQGVLSFQFMVDLDDNTPTGRSVGAGVKALAGPRCFVDFRFVPLLDDEEAEIDALGAEE
jgi:cell cycle checkpoint protein